MDIDKIISGLMIFVLLAIVIELLVGVLVEKLPKIITKYINANLWSIILGVLVALTFKMNMFAVFGLETSWIAVTWILTGLGLAGGSKLWHELISKIRASRQDIV